MIIAKFAAEILISWHISTFRWSTLEKINLFLRECYLPQRDVGRAGKVCLRARTFQSNGRTPYLVGAQGENWSPAREEKMLTRSSAIFYTSCVHNWADVSRWIYYARLRNCRRGSPTTPPICTLIWIHVGSTFPHVHRQKRNSSSLALRTAQNNYGRRYAKHIAFNTFQFTGTKRKHQNHFPPLLCQRARICNSECFETRLFPQRLCAPVIWLLRRFRSFFRPSGRWQFATVLLSEAQTKEYPLLLFSPPLNYLSVYKHAAAFLFLS